MITAEHESLLSEAEGLRAEAGERQKKFIAVQGAFKSREAELQATIDELQAQLGQTDGTAADAAAELEQARMVRVVPVVLARLWIAAAWVSRSTLHQSINTASVNQHRVGQSTPQDATHALQERADALQKLAAAQLAETMALQQTAALQEQIAALQAQIQEASVVHEPSAQGPPAPSDVDKDVAAELEAMRCVVVDLGAKTVAPE